LFDIHVVIPLSVISCFIHEDEIQKHNCECCVGTVLDTLVIVFIVGNTVKQ
jgi:hypothetical protein